jgi:hypothetical protein
LKTVLGCGLTSDQAQALMKRAFATGQVSAQPPAENLNALYSRSVAAARREQGTKSRRRQPYPQLAGLKGAEYRNAYNAIRREERRAAGLTSQGEVRRRVQP